ncbi:unnamed protein product [Somion occarium]|uniref:Extracellular serine-rich protein n=1 Tax=Somion occarium TaxID=3059160 RepID=A0ABP1D6A1_9APHY
MHFTAAFTALALATLAAAQNQTVQVQVGATATSPGGVFQFIPPTITATNGSVITFVFNGAPGNHTVTQSTFDNPCAQAQGGFDSGYIQIPAGTTQDFPTWNLTIENDQTPLWFYCAQTVPGPHCFSGMVGAINPPTTGGRTFQAFQSAAQAAGSSAFSGTPTPALSGAGAVATAAPGPFSGSITGFAIPTSGAGASSGSSGATSSTGSAPAPTTTGGGNNSGAITIAANGMAAFLAIIAGAALM